MERELELKLDAIMGKPGVVGVACMDKRGLCVSGDSSSDSSDEAEMAGSPKRSRAAVINTEEILHGSVRSASYNIVFQVLTRLFTFGLNAFILRYINHEVLGICNVRLALLYSSVMFLSREPFRRTCLRKRESESWDQIVNLVWLVVPNTAFWSILFGYIWCNFLSQPGEPDSELFSQYRKSVWLICFALILDSFAEVPYILGQYFQFAKLRIVADSSLIAVRSSFLCVAVIFFPSYSLSYYAFGSLIGAGVVCTIYFGFFYYYLNIQKKNDLGFSSVVQFFPDFRNYDKLPAELCGLVWSFYKQGILKQILTEGERYLMTFLDLLTFEEQGVYDLISSLGSLAARFVFLPIEENAYYFFAKTLQRKCQFTNRDKKLAFESAELLGILVRIMLIIGMVVVVYGTTFSNTVLHLYGGKSLSDNSVATNLLRANCVYILIIALNGVMESFTFAVMTQAQLDRFNNKLVLFSFIFLAGATLFSKLFGGIGFYLANSLNMSLRIAQSALQIRDVFIGSIVDPFEEWRLNKYILIYFTTAFIVINVLPFVLGLGRLTHVIFGLLVFAANLGVIVNYDKPLLLFFKRMYKLKGT